MSSLIVVSLSIYALASLLTRYDGLFGIFYRLRKIRALESVLGCAVCTAVWLSIPFFFLFPWFVVLPSLGIVIIIEELRHG